MPFRVAADVLRHLLPADVGMSPETLRAHTLKIGEQLGDIPTAKPIAVAMSITVTTDSTFIRSCEEGNRHLEVRVGNDGHWIKVRNLAMREVARRSQARLRGRT